MRTPYSHGDPCLVINERRVQGFRPKTETLPSNIQMVVGQATGLPILDQAIEPLSDGEFKRGISADRSGILAIREEWLEAAVGELDHRVFSKAGYPAPQVKVSVGFPSKKATSRRKQCVGQCWPRGASDDRLNQIFLSPLLTSPEEIVDVLIHELVHAVDDCTSGHRGLFWTICKTIGLTKGTPATAAADEALAATIAEICRALGPLPHATLHALDAEKKQTTRLLKVECPACGYTCRITAKWIVRGLPVCPCGTCMTAIEIGSTPVGRAASLNRATKQIGD